MKWRRPKRRVRADPSRLRLWPIGWALAACFAAALIGLAGLTWLALVLLRHPKLPHSSTVSLHDFVGVLQLVFASVAGAGALVALVMAYRRQRVAETGTAHDRTRVLNERFTAIAAQLGDQNAAVRLAGVHAMAGLADDWEENRQTCIDVLCAYLRIPYEPEPGDDAPAAGRLSFRGNREVRHTVIRVITAHLRKDARVSWQGRDLDFTGVVFDGGDFSGALFSGGEVGFGSAQFSGGTVYFTRTQFSGGNVYFGDAQFSGGKVYFGDAQFSGGQVNFIDAELSGGEVSFGDVKFSAGTVYFGSAQFSGGNVYFGNAQFSGGKADFVGAQFSGCKVYFSGTEFSGSTVYLGDVKFSGGEVYFQAAQFSGGTVSFGGAEFSGCKVHFIDAEFSGGKVYFRRAEFSGGKVHFSGAEFSGGTVSFGNAQFSGGEVSFEMAEFTGGEVDFSMAANWSHPPTFSWQSNCPAGVELPAADRGLPS